MTHLELYTRMPLVPSSSEALAQAQRRHERHVTRLRAVMVQSAIVNIPEEPTPWQSRKKSQS